MVYHENTPIDRIYYGSTEVLSVLYNSEVVWYPTEYPDEEGQFEPDEHHPTDSFFTDYYYFIGYLRVEPARYDAVRIHDEGTI